MAYAVAVEPKPGYLHVRVTGENSAETVRGYLADVLRECIQRRCPAVLIEEDLRGPGLKLLEIFQIASQGPQDAWPHVRWIAYLDANPEHSQVDMKFAATTATNRGLNVRVFTDVDAAARWLGEVTARRDG
jgi:hypothetical protein